MHMQPTPDPRMNCLLPVSEQGHCKTPSDATPTYGSCSLSCSSRVHSSEQSSQLLCTEGAIYEETEDENIVGVDDKELTAVNSMIIDNDIVKQIANQIRDDLTKQKKMRQQAFHDVSSTCPGGTCNLSRENRAIIVGWMREVAGALGLQLSTLFTAVSILDRFVAAAKVLPPDNMLQLLSLACMSVAVKYNEAVFVRTTTWLSMAVDSEQRVHYKAEELHDFEMSVLQAIDWRLHEPNTYSFMVQYLVCLKQAQELLAAPAGDIGSASSCPQGLRVLSQKGSPLWHWFAQAAENLAITSVSYDTFLLYEHSTVALACICLAVNMVAVSAGLQPSCVFDTARVVVSITGMPTEHLNPSSSLGPCAEALDHAYRWMLYCICIK